MPLFVCCPLPGNGILIPSNNRAGGESGLSYDVPEEE